MHTDNTTTSRAWSGDPAYDDYARAYDGVLDHYGVTVRPSFVNAGPAGRIFVAESGAGTPVVFLHGTPATSVVWIPLVARLTGVRAYLVDRPGHGLSDPFDYADVPDLRSHAVAFVDRLLDALGLEQAVLAGNSLGGLWCLWAAADLPARVRSVVAIGAPPGLLEPRVPRIFGPLSVPWIARLMQRVDPPSLRSTRRLFRVMGDPPSLLDATIAEAFTEGLRLPNAEGGMSHMIQRFVTWPGRFADRRSWLDAAELGAIRQPVLIVWGAKDFIGDLTVAHHKAGALPDATVVEAGTGHLPWLQDPSAVADAVHRFL